MLPPALSSLEALAWNLWWSWDAEATALWAEIDPLRWEVCHHNPVALLLDVEPARLAELAADPSFVARVDAVHARFRAYLGEEGWCAEAAPGLRRQGVAYFSMEFGLHESLRLYSGGLGVLAGDHLRSASDLGVPITGVSLLYRQGYFRQVIDEHFQLAAYPQAHYERLPVKPCLDGEGRPVQVSVPMGTHEVHVRVWQLEVGRARLLLLDTDFDANNLHDRRLTHQLYGGDHAHRIRQEVVLGLGGVRALRALGVQPAVYHLNEGHSAFVGLQLIADELAGGARFDEALERTRHRCVFTTHTPVPAGHDRFDWNLVNRTLGPWRDALGLPKGTFMDLGRVRPGDWEEPLCMTVLALRTSAASNGVSRLHGAVSREMWHAMWPDRPVDEVPIGHVTNGVHPIFWMAPESRELFDRYVPGWRERVWDPEVWAAALDIPDEALWELRNRLRGQLVAEVLRRTGQRLDPQGLTICFARRFAPYKRGDLIFREPERLLDLFENGVPGQIVFAGKAHPRDELGQEILGQVVKWSRHRAFRERVVFLEDYDITLGRLLTSGADVWLNNPRRPKEASGTSGQKVVLNGGLNLSVLDGWWPEGYDATNGFEVGDGREWTDEREQDAYDAASLYRTLEQEVFPSWRDRDDSGIPRGWIQRVRRSIATCAPLFNSHRMVRDYALDLYAPRCER